MRDEMPHSEWGNVFREPDLLAALKADPLVLGIRANAGHFYVALDTPLAGRNKGWAEDSLTDVLDVHIILCEPNHPGYARAAHRLYARDVN